MTAHRDLPTIAHQPPVCPRIAGSVRSRTGSGGGNDLRTRGSEQDHGKTTEMTRGIDEKSAALPRLHRHIVRHAASRGTA